MRVGILGSWKRDFDEWPLRGTAEEFSSACRELGRDLARHHATVILGGYSERTADAHIVRGVLDVAQGSTPSEPLIEVLRPATGDLPHQEQARSNPGLFRFHQGLNRQWTATHLLTVRESDCVLAIGGNEGTYNGGLAAIVARKILVPIASFGAAAARLLQDLTVLGTPLATRNDLLSLNNPWGPDVLAAWRNLAGLGRKPRLMLIHGHSPDRFELESWLQRHPDLCQMRVMQNEFAPGNLIPQKIEDLSSWADAAIALATPDDEGSALGAPASPRARQNVWVEVGWFWGRLGLDRILLLKRGSVEIPSDLSGAHYVTYSQQPSERAEDIRSFLSRIRH